MKIESPTALPSTTSPYQPWPLEPEIIINPSLLSSVDTVQNSPVRLENPAIPLQPTEQSTHTPFMQWLTEQGAKPRETDVAQADPEIAVHNPPCVSTEPDICHEPPAPRSSCRKRMRLLANLAFFSAGIAVGTWASWRYSGHNVCNCPASDVEEFDVPGSAPLL